MNESVLVAVVGLVGVIAGSLITAFVNYLTVRMTVQRESETWQRQQEEAARLRDLEMQSRLEDRNRAQIEYVAGLYRDSIQALASLSAVYANMATKPQTEVTELIEAAASKLTLLSIHLAATTQDENSQFSFVFNRFLEDPVRNSKQMLVTVQQFSLDDERLYSTRGASRRDAKQGLRKIQIDVEPKFRQEKFEEGVEIPANHIITCDLSELEPAHRAKIWDVYYSGNRIPERFELRLPSVRTNSGELVLQGGMWKAALDPTQLSPVEIFDAWVQEYDNALADIAVQATDNLAAASG